ncbi:hypothetical protein DL546_005297 [Coniochaeta pulveracea]|uniref:Uncharacterized protein n=1 Tax=Coniochaeta pulveracea TaxID=177199 RepID=A0A420Y6D0_9PEZI|nr:hypothetical protein DL546_005297 [Coniochaeta pulveracea]
MVRDSASAITGHEIRNLHREEQSFSHFSWVVEKTDSIHENEVIFGAHDAPLTPDNSVVIATHQFCAATDHILSRFPISTGARTAFHLRWQKDILDTIGQGQDFLAFRFMSPNCTSIAMNKGHL